MFFQVCVAYLNSCLACVLENDVLKNLQKAKINILAKLNQDMHKRLKDHFFDAFALLFARDQAFRLLLPNGTTQNKNLLKRRKI